MDEKDEFTVDEPLTGNPRDQAAARAHVIKAESESPVGLMEAATRQALALLADAREERKLLLADARAEAKRMVDDARTDAKRILDDARAEAKHLLDEAKSAAEAINETADRQRSEMRAISRSTGELVEFQVKTLEDLGRVHTILSQPVERTPSAMESVGKSLEAMVGEVRQLAQYAIKQEPRLLTAASMRIGGPGVLLAEPPKRAAEPPAPEAGPERPEAASAAAPGPGGAPPPSIPPLSELGLGDVQVMLQTLGAEYVDKFCATHQLPNLTELKLGHIQRIYQDYCALQRSRSAG